MSLKRDSGQCGSDLFSNYGSENPPSIDVKQDMFRDGTASTMNGINNSEFTDSMVLDDSNLASVMHYDDMYKTKTSENSDQSDAMTDFLVSLVKMERILEKKQKAVALLKEMNETVECQTSVESSPVTPAFQHKYATLILHLDELNQELKYHINVVLRHITEIARTYGIQDVFVTNWRRRCEDEAYEIVNRIKSSQGSSTVDESKFILVTKLTTILTLLSHLQENRMSNSELSCIEEVFTDIRQHLHPSNLKCFEQSVEQLISHIVLNLSPSILPMSTPNAANVPHSSNANPTEPPYLGHSTS